MLTFKDVYDYIKLSKEERQKHLDLNLKCCEIGGNSTAFKALLAFHLKTTIPSGMGIQLCHACHNGNCSEVKHLYWGTPSENTTDTYENGRKSIWEHQIEKYGLEKVLEQNKKKGQKAANALTKYYESIGGRNHPKTESHKKRLSEVNKGKKFYTNGIVNISLKENEIPPDGFKRGMTRFKKNHQKGEKNSQYGTMWITNGIETKKIRKTDSIPDGWKNGVTR